MSRLDTASLETLRRALEHLGAGFDGLPPSGAQAGPDPDERSALEDVLMQAAERLRDNYPYFHPLYAGQMLKPPHPVARLAYALAQHVNPNNHALDGGRASSAMEKEAVAGLAAMLGWTEHLGHLTGGGTMANLEALWVAGRTHPGKAVAASAEAHYTHRRISEVIGLPFREIAADRRGRMDLAALETRLRSGEIGTVVATLGTTATGAVDPLPGLLALRERIPFRIHADAAYGGYFTLASNLGREARAAFDLIGQADSVVIDPHKHGLQPYGCGCVLFRDPSAGALYRHESPYTYFTSDELHLGEISLECSRPGAAAVALWATQRLLPLVPGGRFAGMLSDCRAAALAFAGELKGDPRFLVPLEPELDIVVFAARAAGAAESSRRARAIFDEAARRGLHLALTQLPASFFDPVRDRELIAGAERITCLRSVLMKPEHRAWVPGILERLRAAADAVSATA